MWWCGERRQTNLFMLVLIVVEVVERGEISPAVAQQGGWGVGAGHWARVSWGIRVRIRIRDTSRNKDIFRSVVNKPIPLGRPPLQVFLLHFSLYIYIFYFHPTPHPAPSICKMSAQARGKAKEKPIASLLAGATAGGVEAFITFPLESVKTQLQFGALDGGKVGSSIFFFHTR